MDSAATTTQRRTTTKLKRRKRSIAARRQHSSAAGLQKQLDQRTRELNEAREQQAATSEILRVISGSLTDVQPVFDTIVRSAVRLCDGIIGAVQIFDGELTHVVAVHNYTPEALAAIQRMYPMRPGRQQLAGRADRVLLVAHHGPISIESIPLVRGTVAGRSVLDKRTIHIADMQTQAGEFPETSENARRWASARSFASL